ncbi:unnamed protein product [Soboliphyme baturini]|uniref:Secreted protein n=1 Tax=Soboliphyme baturini TaxID=241478 RepID=A0A183IJP0_9BILA|nr:unnamed protein product [Soboliphyme baturini]
MNIICQHDCTQRGTLARPLVHSFTRSLALSLVQLLFCHNPVLFPNRSSTCASSARRFSAVAAPTTTVTASERGADWMGTVSSKFSRTTNDDRVMALVQLEFLSFSLLRIDTLLCSALASHCASY